MAQQLVGRGMGMRHSPAADRADRKPAGLDDAKSVTDLGAGAALKAESICSTNGVQLVVLAIRHHQHRARWRQTTVIA